MGSSSRRPDFWLVTGCWMASLLAAGADRAPAAEPSRDVDYSREVRPILAKNCFACHGADEAQRKRGLRLDRRDSATKPLADDVTAIVPGDPDASELIFR